MKLTKRKIELMSITCVLIVIAIVFLSLGLTIWRPKTTDEWLVDFSNSLVLKKDQSNQKIEKTIEIEENGTIVSTFYQLVEINNQGGRPVGHIVVDEKYPTIETNEFDTYDEYFFYDNTMYMSRISGVDTTKTQFTSTWEVFWEIVTESIGENKYIFDKGLFDNFELKHKKGIHSLKVTLPERSKSEFFNKNKDAEEFSNINFDISMDRELNLIAFNLQYKKSDLQNIKIKIMKKDVEEIKI